MVGIKIGKRGKMIIGVIFGLCLLLTVYFTVFHMRVLKINGLKNYTTEEFEKLLKADCKTSTTAEFYFRNKFFKKRLPHIESYEIRWANPWSIEVTAYEKIVVGCVKVMGKYMYFDKDGYVVGSKDTRDEFVPEVKGLYYTKITLYDVIDVKRPAVFSTVLEISKLLAANGLDARVIEFDDDNAVTLRIGYMSFLLGQKKAYDMCISAVKGLIEANPKARGTFDLRNYKGDSSSGIVFKED